MDRKSICALGVDLGAVAVKATLLDAAGKVMGRHSALVRGGLGRTAVALIEQMLEGCTADVAVGITGGGKAALDFGDNALVENDLVASARAVGRLYPGAQGIVEVGGHQSKWIKLGGGRQMESFSLNDQCAAGSGAFLEQQAGRLALGIEEFSVMAESAPRGATIAGRCAVFAKSDMIHQQQKGTPPSEIAYGLCLALARNFRATLMRGGELVTPAVLVGGGALNHGLTRAFLEVFELKKGELVAADDPQFMASLGVAAEALARGPVSSVDKLVVLAQAVSTGGSGNAGRGLTALHSPEATTLPEPIIDDSRDVAAYLGVDVGSVSTDFALVSPDGEVLDGIYLRTRGDPLGVLKEGLAILKERVGERLEVLGVGTTGSGRHLAGKLLGADVVKNEITCQLYGARHVLPEVDTILEIGGQDSKYVSVKDGRVTDFVMNKICAAGTGSFLEEQGESLGVSIKGEFEEIALRGKNPPDLGSQCTVFMDTEVVNARQRGVDLTDILSGLSYCVVKNYLERVVAGRTIGESVVFQGGVASNAAVVSAFEKMLGKPVAVHPYNRISGAIGAAVAARDEAEAGPTKFRGLECVAAAEARTFECKACSNMCQVSRISTPEGQAFFGDICERFTAEEGQSVPRDLPDLVSEVVELLESYSGGEAWLGTAGIPLTSMMYDLLPFWGTLLKSLGFRVVLSSPSSQRTLEDGIRRLTAEVCLPTKLAYGHVASLVENPDVDFVFLPSILDLLDCTDARAYLCPFEESVGFMTATFASHRMIVPAVYLASPRQRIIRELQEKLSDYELSEYEVSEALDDAYGAQAQFDARLQERGKEVMAKDFGLAFALLGKPYNVLDPFENLNLARHIRRLGILPIPMQMLPVEPADLKDHGMTIPWRYNRGVLRSLMGERGDGRVFPVVISNFGCGPDAFAMKHVEAAAGQAPYLFLEFDEHRGEAGLITRLEAFIDEVSHITDRRRSAQIALKKPPQRPGRKFEGRRFVLPHFADHVWAYSGALKFADYEVVVLPPPDDETLSYGEEVSSGKECHPYMLLAGDLIKHVERGNIGEGDVYFFPGTEIACLLHEYGSGMRLALERRGISGVDVLSPGGSEHMDVFGTPAVIRLGRGLLLSDLMVKLKCQVRPYAKDPQKVDELFEAAYREVAVTLAEERVGDTARQLTRELEKIALVEQPLKPVVGVAGDIYTRIHPFGNRGLFNKLEAQGLEVWPAPFLTDIVDFGFGREISGGVDEGRYLEAAGAAVLKMRKEMEAYRVRYLLGRKIGRAEEPGYQQVLELAAPYVDKSANELVILNVAKMVDYARGGAHGIINAISFHCMLGTVSASLAENVRRDHDMIPLTTIVYTGKESSEVNTKLEAFAHQVKEYAAKPKPPSPPSGARTWFANLWDSKTTL